MQQQNKEGAGALRNSSMLIEEEIAEIKKKENPTERDKSNMLDLEETRQEILVKIQEIEETQAQVSYKNEWKCSLYDIHTKLIISDHC